EEVDARRDERDRRAVRLALEPGDVPDRLLAVRRRGEAVHRVRGYHDELPGFERADGFFYSHLPSTTRSRSARSGQRLTSRNRSEVSSPTVAPAPPSAPSSTSQPPGRRTSGAARAIASVTPRPTSASRGSQSRTSGSRESISSGRT